MAVITSYTPPPPFSPRRRQRRRADDGIVRAWEQKYFLHPSMRACVHIGKLSKSVSHRWRKALFALRLHGISETQSSLLWVRRGATRTRRDAAAPVRSRKSGAPLTSPRGATPLSKESALGKHADAPWESFFLDSSCTVEAFCASGERPPRLLPIADAGKGRWGCGYDLRLVTSCIVSHINLSPVASTLSDSENLTESNCNDQISA